LFFTGFPPRVARVQLLLLVKKLARLATMTAGRSYLAAFFWQ